MPTRTVQLSNQHHPALQFNEAQVSGIFSYLDQRNDFKITSGDISIAFVNEPTICQLHEQFLNDASPTDVITFPADSLMDFAGEICVNVELAARVASEHHNTFPQELTLYLVHGWLHLAGLDDHCDEDCIQMRIAESKLMGALIENDKIPEFTIAS